MKIVCATAKEQAYAIAAEEFKKYFYAVTGEMAEISADDDEVSDLAIIGTAAVNRVLAAKELNDEIRKLPVRTGTDDHAVKSCTLGARKILLLQGGNARSTLYAVYAYFESIGCAWFWDGDVVPEKKVDELLKIEVDAYFKERFIYRGIRYFAHRGCKRFQAEMWDFNDWKKEIDYLVKRKINLFMLRIGQDDLFQRTFPSAVKYPTKQTMSDLCYQNEALDGGYDDRRLFWSLEYRGKLREKVLTYAFGRGLIHPEDFGTMTHWYSPTPADFIENTKDLSFYDDAHYGRRQRTKVWDVKKDNNFEYYNLLTETSIKEYGKSEAFHTIGFAERNFYSDRKKNFQMKKYVYDRFIQKINDKYPNSPVFIASWDLWLMYKPSEVEDLLRSFNMDKCLLFDYTSDSAYENNFTKWNVIGKLPYVFGLFHGYASYNDLLGNYELTEKRLGIAKADECCKGIIMWPELSHSDILMQEFFTDNAWSDELITVDTALCNLCEKRYGEFSYVMIDLWREFLPIVELVHWNMHGDSAVWYTEYYWYDLKRRYLPWLIKGEGEIRFADGVNIVKAVELVVNAKKCLRLIAGLSEKALNNEFIKRDVTDILRTTLGRYANICLIKTAAIINGDENKTFKTKNASLYAIKAENLLDVLSKVLSTSREFSLFATLNEIQATENIFDGFETTLKNNTLNAYCRTGVYETVKEVLLPELKALREFLPDVIEKEETDLLLKRYGKVSDEIVRSYLMKPLSEIKEERKIFFKDVIRDSVKAFENLDFNSEV